MRREQHPVRSVNGYPYSVFALKILRFLARFGARTVGNAEIVATELDILDPGTEPGITEEVRQENAPSPRCTGGEEEKRPTGTQEPAEPRLKADKQDAQQMQKENVDSNIVYPAANIPSFGAEVATNVPPEAPKYGNHGDGKGQTKEGGPGPGRGEAGEMRPGGTAVLEVREMEGGGKSGPLMGDINSDSKQEQDETVTMGAKPLEVVAVQPGGRGDEAGAAGASGGKKKLRQRAC